MKVLKPILFSATHRIFMEPDDISLVRQRLNEDTDHFIRREHKNDWVFEGKSFQKLMGLEHDEALIDYNKDPDANAVIRVDDRILTIQTDHIDAPVKEEAIVVDGVASKLLDGENLERFMEQWFEKTNNSTSVPRTVSYSMTEIPAELEPHLQDNPNFKTDGKTAIYRAMNEGNEELFDYLMAHPDIEPHMPSDKGFTPLTNFYPNGRWRKYWPKLINHPKTTLQDLKFLAAGQLTPMDHAKEYDSDLVILLETRIRELGGSV